MTDRNQSAASPALELSKLSVAYTVRGRDLPVLSDVSLRIERGEAYGLVGESGCGKSTVALALQRVLPPNGRISGGHARVAGQDVMELGAAALRNMRANDIAMVFQDPGKALNPSLTVGRQIAEVFEILGASGSDNQGKQACKARAQATVDNAHMRYFILHAHKLIDPRGDAA